MRILRIGVLAAIGLSTPCAMAKPAVVVTLNSVGDRVRSQNPELAAARWRIREALGRSKQAGRLDNPEWETEVEHDTRFREARIGMELSQRFPVTGRLKLEKELSLTGLEAAEAEVREVARGLVTESRAALVEVLAIRERRSLLKQQAGLTAKLAESIQSAAEKGEGSLLDAGQARVESLRVATEARQLDAREAAAVGELKPLLGIPMTGQLVVSGKLPPAQLHGRGADPNLRPDYQMAKLQAEAAARGVALEEARRYEDLEAGVFAAVERTEDAPDGLENDTIVGLRIKIPLPLWNKNEGNIEEAQARLVRRKLETDALGQSIELEADASMAEMREWKSLISDIGGKLLPLAEQQAADAETAWHNGQTDLQTVLRAREQTLELAGTRLDALRDFHLARVRYLAATGSR